MNRLKREKTKPRRSRPRNLQNFPDGSYIRSDGSTVAYVDRVFKKSNGERINSDVVKIKDKPKKRQAG